MDDVNAAVLLARMLAGPVAALASAMVLVLVLGPVVLYLVARWRGATDAHLGIKFALHYFGAIGLQLALAGAAVVVWALVSPGSGAEKSAPLRAGVALVMPAGLVIAMSIALLRRTNDAALPGVRRLFAGYAVIVTGLVGMLGLVLAFQALLAKGSTRGLGPIAAALVVVHGTAWAVVCWRFSRLVLDDQAPPIAPVAGPPAPPPPVPPGLPPLGGGSYPPLNQT